MIKTLEKKKEENRYLKLFRKEAIWEMGQVIFTNE